MIEQFFLPIVHLSRKEQEEMFSLFQTHFQNVNQEQFTADLGRKHWAILLREAGVIKGFSTLYFCEAVLNGETVRIVYSGDTITDPSIWSSPALAQAWVSGIQAIHQGRSEKLYWLLISSGYRTYRFLSTFARIFYPCYKQPKPPEIEAFIHDISSQLFPEYYDRVTGIVRFPQPQILRPELRRIPPEKLQDPNVVFFMEMNKNHGDGDELVCLTEVSETNLTRAGLRIWKTTYPLHIPFPLNSIN